VYCVQKDNTIKGRVRKNGKLKEGMKGIKMTVFCLFENTVLGLSDRQEFANFLFFFFQALKS
jgi:hypothetical protein